MKSQGRKPHLIHNNQHDHREAQIIPRTPKAITKAYIKIEKLPQKLTTNLFVKHRPGTNPDHLEKEAVQKLRVRRTSLDENNGHFSKNKTETKSSAKQTTNQVLPQTQNEAIKEGYRKTSPLGP